MKIKKLKFAVLNGWGSWLAASGVAITTASLSTTTAKAHGYVGDRFFPPTIQTDDPFATDELALPTVSTMVNPGSPATRETDVGASFSKEIFPNLALSFSETYVLLSPEGMPTIGGFDNLSLNVKYQLWENAPHEAIFSVGADWDVGGTGAKKIGADSANVFTPTIYYGKGFGDLPDALKYAKPFALTGTLGLECPTSADPNNLDWAFALEYSLPYLQSQVRDIGLPGPFKHMIPLVEFSFSAPFNRGGGPTTGTINPGILYENNYFQIGTEAIIPANSATGGRVGVVFQIQLYIDDIWPKSFGHPLFGL